MRRRSATAGALAPLALGLAAVAALSLLAPLAGGAPRGEDQVPSRLGVRGSEWDLVLSRARLPFGPALVQFQNAGEDPHDLRLQHIGGTRELGTGEVGPGNVQSFSVRWLKRGERYRLWCSLPTHADLGMEATLRVQRRR